MTSGQKIFLSLLLSVALFTGFILLAETTLFSKIETDFYAQAKISEAEQQLDLKADGYNDYITDILNKLTFNTDAYVKSACISSFLMQNPSEADIAQRKQKTESLFYSIPSLEGLRLLDKNGISVHYSTFDSTDILKITGITKVYKNYPDIIKNTDAFQASQLKHSDKDLSPTLLFNNEDGRLIISIPLCIGDGIYSADFIFYFNLHKIQQELASKGILAAGENPVSISGDDNKATGLIFGVPNDKENEFINLVLQFWNEDNSSEKKSGVRLLSDENGNQWAVLNSTDRKYFIISGIYRKTDFELSREIKLLVDVCIFFTILLFLLLIFSLKQDPMNVIRKRIKSIQVEILKDYLEKKETTEWSKFLDQIKGRKNIFADQVKKSLGRTAKHHEKEIDSFINSSWEEIIRILTLESGITENEKKNITIEDIRKVVEDVLKNTNINVRTIPTPVSAPAKPAVHKQTPVSIPEPIEEADSIESAEEVIEDGEPVEAAEEVIEDGETVESAEEIIEDGEAIESAEEVIEDGEAIESAEEVIEDGEAIESAEEVIEDGETVEVAEEIETADELPTEAEEIETAENIESAEEVIEDGETVEVAEEIETADDVPSEPEEIETAENIESVEEVEEIVEDGESVEPEDAVEEAESLVSEAKVTDYGDFITPAEEISGEAEALTETIDITQEFIDVLEPETLADTSSDTPEEPDEVEDLEETEELEEIETTEEVPELPPEAAAEPVITCLNDEKRIYIETEENEFPNLDNILGEEMCIGGKYILAKTDNSPLLNFDAAKLRFIKSEKDTIQELESPDTAVFTGFAQSDEAVTDLESAENENIVKSDGVYSISEKMKFTDVVVDPAFKELVDSICAR